MAKDTPRQADEPRPEVVESINKAFGTINKAPRMGLRDNEAYRTSLKEDVAALLGRVTSLKPETIKTLTGASEDSALMGDDTRYYRGHIARSIAHETVVSPYSTLTEPECRHVLRKAKDADEAVDGESMFQTTKRQGNILSASLEGMFARAANRRLPKGERDAYFQRAEIAASAMVAVGLISESTAAQYKRSRR